ncbi:hypothetical protein Goklo_021853 [Gossypium klotzschianum]|uniref:Uncharacterized protein n=1 Tax=Gossypium klotzschianum TaxID=34286 RepID=A0A7J8UWZ3_9ROSI|nr:hypothetical protein [Gossypium klotzschianum]
MDLGGPPMGFRWGTLSENPWAAPNGILPSLLLLVVTISFAAATLKFTWKHGPLCALWKQC